MSKKIFLADPQPPGPFAGPTVQERFAMDLLEACCSSRTLWEELLHAMQQALIVTDPEGVVLFASPAVERIVGYGPKELAGKNLGMLFTTEDLSCLYPNLLYLGRKRESFLGEAMLHRSNGTGCHVQLSVRPYHPSAEAQHMIIFCLEDISAQKQIEKRVNPTHYEDLIKLASGIAHEIRNPLVGIGGFVNRLFKVCGEADAHLAYRDHIMYNLRKIENLIQKVEYFAQLPQPGLSYQPIRSLIEEVLESYREPIADHRIELSIDLPNQRLHLDRDLIARIIGILIDNALDAMADGGRITIRSEQDGNEFILFVIDSGKGIPTEDLPYIFNPFFSSKPDGAGIDLSIAKRIMESHQGSITVESLPGVGTAFALHFRIEHRRSIRRVRFEEPA